MGSSTDKSHARVKKLLTSKPAGFSSSSFWERVISISKYITSPPSSLWYRNRKYLLPSKTCSLDTSRFWSYLLNNPKLFEFKSAYFGNESRISQGHKEGQNGSSYIKRWQSILLPEVSVLSKTSSAKQNLRDTKSWWKDHSNESGGTCPNCLSLFKINTGFYCTLPICIHTPLLYIRPHSPANTSQ